MAAGGAGGGGHVRLRGAARGLGLPPRHGVTALSESSRESFPSQLPGPLGRHWDRGGAGPTRIGASCRMLAAGRAQPCGGRLTPRPARASCPGRLPRVDASSAALGSLEPRATGARRRPVTGQQPRASDAAAESTAAPGRRRPPTAPCWAEDLGMRA